MFNSDILDVVIGLAFVYFLLSLLATTVGELIARGLALRSATLVDAIRNVLANTDGRLLAGFWTHPRIMTLSLNKTPEQLPAVDPEIPLGVPPRSFRQGFGAPSYMAAAAFTDALLDTVFEQTKHKTGRDQLATTSDVRLAFAALADPEVRRLFLAIIGIDSKPLEQTKKELAKWFDEYMERVSGWYKRKAQVIALVLGLTLAALLNVDTLTIANSLLANPTLRDSVVKIASDYVNDPANSASSATGETPPVTDPKYLAEKANRIAELQDTLLSLKLPILWLPADPNSVDPREVPSDWEGWLYKVAGLLATGLLVSLGAPFWFDLLSRITNIRSTGKVPEKAPVKLPDTEPDASLTKGAAPSNDQGIQPIVEPPSPPSAELNELALRAIQIVETLKVGGHLSSRAEEDAAGIAFMGSEVAQEGWTVSKAQLAGAWAAARERRQAG